MPFERMDINSVVVGGGPVASLVVLRTRPSRGEKPRQLPIRIGGVEAAAISMGVDEKPHRRPMTHDLLATVITELGARCVSVRITSVQDTTFYAQVELQKADGSHSFVDARPSDALALAVRTHAPVYVKDSVLEAATFPDFKAVEADERDRELEEFHDFVENLNPEDFNVEKGAE